eukprot:1189084-Prorocentrum_minimum.AAC.1
MDASPHGAALVYRCSRSPARSRNNKREGSLALGPAPGPLSTGSSRKSSSSSSPPPPPAPFVAPLSMFAGVDDREVCAEEGSESEGAVAEACGGRDRQESAASGADSLATPGGGTPTVPAGWSGGAEARRAGGLGLTRRLARSERSLA